MLLNSGILNLNSSRSSTAVAIALMLSIGTQVSAAELCPRSAAKGSVFESQQPFLTVGTENYTSVEKRMNISETIHSITTSGYVLKSDVTFDGDYAGVVLAGTVLEYQDSGEISLCSLGRKRGTLQLCYMDHNKDGQFELGSVIKIGFWGSKAKSFNIGNQPPIERIFDVAKRATSTDELPMMTVLVGSSVYVRKLKKKKYVDIAFGYGSGTVSKLSDKQKKRCGAACITYYREQEKIRVEFTDLKPVTFAGVTLNFKLDEKGKLLVASEGFPAAADAEISCDRKLVSLPGIEISKW